MVTARDLIDAFYDHLKNAPEALMAYHKREARYWTSIATEALIKAGEAAFPDAVFAAKGHPDSYGRSEYFTFDVIGYDHDSWGPPLFVAEHENRVSAKRLQYEAWKLYSIEAQRRMLVGYWRPGTDVPSFEGMFRLVKEVAGENPGKDIILIGAKWDAAPENTDELRQNFESRIVGVHHR